MTFAGASLLCALGLRIHLWSPPKKIIEGRRSLSQENSKLEISIFMYIVRHFQSIRNSIMVLETSDDSDSAGNGNEHEAHPYQISIDIHYGDPYPILYQKYEKRCLRREDPK